jgi:uncharacterized protein YegP (UPF0339 family)
MTEGQTISVEVYKDAAGEWRWRLRDPDNLLIIAASTEGYKNRADAESNLRRIQWLLGLKILFIAPVQG